jgi:hypothetical protein
MAKWADSSNNFKGTFSQFTAGQGLNMGQVITQAARDAQHVRDAAAKGIVRLTGDKHAGENIRVGDDQYAKIVDRSKIDTSNWNSAYSDHAKALESPPVPAHRDWRLKIYDQDPDRGDNNIAVTHPTWSINHVRDWIRLRVFRDSRVNARNADQFLKEPDIDQ